MEGVIAYHCAPALAGIKPSNIVACYKDKIEDIHGKIRQLNLQLNERDIYLAALCECKKRVLVMVYRKKVLRAALAGEAVRDFLTAYGYPESGDVEQYIDFLRQRMKSREFPHEIGAFLGYPLSDIYGFIHHKDEGCLLCGEWKVYQNPEEAKRMFARFAACRRAVAKRIACGQTLAQVFCVA